MYHYIIVDDEPLIRLGTLKKLEPLSEQICCIGEADNGQQAVRFIQETTPDFAIIDMEMPIMDGTQLLPYLADNYPSLQLIVISGYKSFDYIKHAISANVIDYILKPFTDEQIQQTVLQALAKLEASESISAQIRLSEEQKELAYFEYDIQLIQNLILDYGVTDKTISSQKLSFIRQSRRIYLALVYAGTALELIDFQRHLITLGFSEMVLYLPHPKNSRLGFFVICIPNDADFNPKDFNAKLMQDFISYLYTYNTVSYWGISSAFSSADRLHEAYEQARTALNSMPVSQTRSEYFQWSPGSDTNIREIIWEKKEEFLFRIEAGMSAEVYRLLDELQEYYRTDNLYSLADIKYHYHQLTEECLLILKQYLKQTKSSQSMQNIVKEMFTSDELHKYFAQFFGNIAEMLKPQSVYAVDDTIERIKIYVQRNYQKNITVEFLSSLFFMNSSYLSHMFRKQTGEKFVHYLNTIRIEKAKSLLTSTDRKLYQIARAVGYDNDKYFLRVFKKLEGITPEKFRKLS